MHKEHVGWGAGRQEGGGRDVIIMSHQTVAWQGVVRQARDGVRAGAINVV